MSLPRLYILVGLPGAGKSSWACEFIKLGMQGGHLSAIINKDSLTSMLNGGTYKFIPEYRAAIKRMDQIGVETLLYDGINVIVDNCNITREKRDEYKSIGVRYLGANITYVFFDCFDINILVRRRMENARNLSQEEWTKVIMSMNQSFEPLTVEETGACPIIHIIPTGVENTWSETRKPSSSEVPAA